MACVNARGMMRCGGGDGGDVCGCVVTLDANVRKLAEREVI